MLDIFFKSSVFVFNENTGFHRNNERSSSMPILNTRGARATRFESSASNGTETNILKDPFVNILRIIGISRGTSCILVT